MVNIIQKTFCFYCLFFICSAVSSCHKDAFIYDKSENIQKNIPVVYLLADTLSTIYAPGYIVLDGNDSIAIKIKYRGAYALSKTKKSFAIKLLDENGDNLDCSFFCMRSDNNWILDAMAVDMARMRNRVSFDLWNDFSRKSYVFSITDESLNGVNGRFVEVYLNNQYWGLYCLMEKLDRKQLKLKKFKGSSMQGALYKSYTWNNTGFWYYGGSWLYDNTSRIWNGWEFSYPDVDDCEPIDWAPLYEDFQWLINAEPEDVESKISDKFDIPVWQDYYLLMDLLLAEDNIVKNQYLYYYDASSQNRILEIAPWDMDHSWGRDYKGDITEKTGADFDLALNNSIVQRALEQYPSVLEMSYKERYAQLRKNFFSEKALQDRFRGYFELFRESGAAQREIQRWDGIDGYHIDFESEEEYILQWITSRLVYLDRKYGY